MKKLLRSRDILLLTLAGIGDIAQEVQDPLHLLSKSYESMYGFVPKRYKKSNFMQTVWRNIRTHNMEKIVKDGKVCLRLTSIGKTKVFRDFPILSLTKRWNKSWVIVVFDIEEKSKIVRNRFRNKLKSLGFGMLQRSVWISPLDIGEDMREAIYSIGLSKDAYVLKVSGFIFGDPKELVRKIWHLERFEEVHIRLKNRIDSLNQLIRNRNDRINKSEGEVRNKYIYDLARKKREAMRGYLEFIVQLPPLPQELLPNSFKDTFMFR